MIRTIKNELADMIFIANKKRRKQLSKNYFPLKNSTVTNILVLQHPKDTTQLSIRLYPLKNKKSMEEYNMSVYIILNYFEECKIKNQKPTWEGLNRSKITWKN